MYLSVVVPAYNESRRLASTILSIESFLDTKKFKSEIIVVDDGSTDRTYAIAHKLSLNSKRLKVLKNSANKGKGYTVKKGLLAASGRVRLFLDADLSTPIEMCDSFLEKIHKYDVLIGSRRMAESDIKVKQPSHRILLGNCFSLLVRTLFPGISIKDTQCGFKMFKEKAAIDIFTRVQIDHFGFDVEILYLANLLGYRYKQMPVVWINNADSSVSTFSDGMRMVWDIVRVKSRYRLFDVSKINARNAHSQSLNTVGNMNGRKKK